jgi:hypothetical protein
MVVIVLHVRNIILRIQMESILAFLDWDAEGSIKHGVSATFRNLSYKTPLCVFRVIVDNPCATGMMLTAQLATVKSYCADAEYWGR